MSILTVNYSGFLSLCSATKLRGRIRTFLVSFFQLSHSSPSPPLPWHRYLGEEDTKNLHAISERRRSVEEWNKNGLIRQKREERQSKPLSKSIRDAQPLSETATFAEKAAESRGEFLLLSSFFHS